MNVIHQTIDRHVAAQGLPARGEMSMVEHDVTGRFPFFLSQIFHTGQTITLLYMMKVKEKIKTD